MKIATKKYQATKRQPASTVSIMRGYHVSQWTRSQLAKFDGIPFEYNRDQWGNVISWLRVPGRAQVAGVDVDCFELAQEIINELAEYSASVEEYNRRTRDYNDELPRRARDLERMHRQELGRIATAQEIREHVEYDLREWARANKPS